MTAILAIDAKPQALRAVVRDPMVRLWIDLEYRGTPGARCLVDGRPVPALRPPDDVFDAVRLAAKLVEARRITVGAVAHRVDHAWQQPAAVIDDAVLDELADHPGPVLDAVQGARATWPLVPHIACCGAGVDIEADMDRQARQLLSREAAEDNRAERMLADPRGYFARARERARREIADEVTRRARRITH
jgi:hypothetical protein